MLSTGKTLEIEHHAQKCNYIKPTKDLSEWTDDECIFATIHMMFHNPILYKTCHVILNIFPLSKTFYRMTLKKYVKYFSLSQESGYT